MARKASGFTQWIGARWNQWVGGGQAPQNSSPPNPVSVGSLGSRLEARFEDMMQEIDQLSSEKPSVEEHVEYGWIVLVRVLLPVVFFLGFGYEDGLFMTGFRYFSWEPFILLMYAIGYCLEGLRVAMVYSMNFSKTQGQKKAYQAQLLIWLVMSVGCGVAQLASALIIQALGGDKAVTGQNAVAQGARAIMAALPWLVYLAIGVRVLLCALADWACSGFLHKRKKTVEQKVAEIATRAGNLTMVLQAQMTAQATVDNARQFQEMVQGQREELRLLREQQKTVFDIVFQAGMRKVNQVVEVSEQRELPSPEE